MAPKKLSCAASTKRNRSRCLYGDGSAKRNRSRCLYGDGSAKRNRSRCLYGDGSAKRNRSRCLCGDGSAKRNRSRCLHGDGSVWDWNGSKNWTCFFGGPVIGPDLEQIDATVSRSRVNKRPIRHDF